MKLIITPEVRSLGIDVGLAVISGAEISNKSRPLEKLKKDTIELIQQNQHFVGNPILQAYRDLYQLCGVTEEFNPPASHLLGLIERNGRLPNINTVVDCYNLVSAQTQLSIGAHDTDHIKGNITFRLTDGHEKYTPLGEEAPIQVSPGEYACCDSEKILCRLDVKQCQETRITKETRQFMVYVQGNRATNRDYLEKALTQVCALIKEICGGSYEVI